MSLQKLTVTVEINRMGAMCLRVKCLGLQNVFSKTIRCNVQYAETKGVPIVINSFQNKFENMDTNIFSFTSITVIYCYIKKFVHMMPYTVPAKFDYLIHQNCKLPHLCQMLSQK